MPTVRDADDRDAEGPPLRVALLCANFPPELLGGTEVVVHGVARALKERGDEVAVFCGSEIPTEDVRPAPSSSGAPGVHVTHGAIDGIPVHRFHRPWAEHEHGVLHRPGLRRAVRTALDEFRADVVHAHHLAPFGVGILLDARAVGRVTAFTFHDLWTTCPRFFRLPPETDAGIPVVACPEGSGRGPCVPCVQFNMPLPTHTVREAMEVRDRQLRDELDATQILAAPSCHAAERVRIHLPLTHRRIEMIENGLSLGARSVLPSVPRGDGAPVRIGSFGNIVRNKGVVALVEALGKVRKDLGNHVPPFELALHGRVLEDGLADELLELAKRSGFRLTLAGPYLASEPHPARSMDLAVFPSLCEETYGLVVDEALAHGVPTLVSDRGALPERAALGGVAVASIEQLASVLADLLGDDEALATLRASIPDASRLPSVRDAASAYRRLYVRHLGAAFSAGSLPSSAPS